MWCSDFRGGSSAGPPPLVSSGGSSSGSGWSADPKDMIDGRLRVADNGDDINITIIMGAKETLATTAAVALGAVSALL